MKHTKTILTSLSLALACTALGCSGAMDGEDDALTLSQVVEDDSRVGADGGVIAVDAGRGRADAGDAGDAGDLDEEDDLDAPSASPDDDDDDEEGCRLRDWMRRRRGEGRALDGGLGVPGFGDFDRGPGRERGERGMGDDTREGPSVRAPSGERSDPREGPSVRAPSGERSDPREGPSVRAPASDRTRD